jgi:hypothetical protein
VEDCQVCGRRFDPFGFQVVVPELGRGFDRIECARSARALASPGSRIAAAPLAAIVEPIGASGVAGAPVTALRPVGTSMTTLGLLAAGTAAVVFLWVRVLGTDTASFPLIRGATPPAVAGETVEAHVQGALGENGPAEARSPVNRSEPDPVTRVLVKRGPTTRPDGATAAGPGPAQAPTRPDRPVARPSVGAKEKGKKDKHSGKGQGHIKHGDTGGTHSPGHGHANGQGHGKSTSHGSGHGKSNGNGHGKSNGRGKKH